MKHPEILDGAAVVLIERGWHQGDYIPRGGDPKTCPCCVIAAMNVAAGKPPDDVLDYDLNPDVYTAAEALAEWLDLDADDGLTEVLGEGWNDDPSMTAERAIHGLRRCAAAERAERAEEARG